MATDKEEFGFSIPEDVPDFDKLLEGAINLEVSDQENPNNNFLPGSSEIEEKLFANRNTVFENKKEAKSKEAPVSPFQQKTPVSSPSPVFPPSPKSSLTANTPKSVPSPEVSLTILDDSIPVFEIPSSPESPPTKEENDFELFMSGQLDEEEKIPDDIPSPIQIGRAHV